MIIPPVQVPVQLPEVVIILWIAALAIAAFVVLPLTIYLLRRILIASRNIQVYLDQMREAGARIAGNAHRIAELDHTVEVAGQMLAVARSIKDHAAIIEAALTARANHDDSA